MTSCTTITYQALLFILYKYPLRIIYSLRYSLYTDHLHIAPHMIGRLGVAANRLRLRRLGAICDRAVAVPSGKVAVHAEILASKQRTKSLNCVREIMRIRV